MNRMSTFLKTLVAIVCLALAGCLDTREEVWIAADASGAARFNVSVPAAAASLYGGEEGIRKLIEENLAEIPAITSHLLKVETGDGRLQVELTITFENIIDLIGSTSSKSMEDLPVAGAEMLGTAEVDFEGRDMDFTRTVELYKAVPGALFFPKSLLDEHSVTTIIHLPAAATTHNATSTANQGRTLIWETSLTEAFKKPTVTSFTMPLPIPWILLSFVALLLLILFAGLIYYFRRRKRARRADQANSASSPGCT
jgi:hypothetical protein